jgi:hypothetical protein
MPTPLDSMFGHLNPTPIQSRPMGGFPNAGQPSIMDAPQVPQQQMQQANFGQRFKQNMGPILQALGMGIASNNLAAGTAALPVLADRRRQGLLEQQELAQKQQQLNMTKEWLKQKRREDLIPLVDAGQADVALRMATEKPDAGPASVQEYQFAQQNGFQGSYMDFKKLGSGGGADAASPLGKLKRDLDAGLITQQQYDAMSSRTIAPQTQGGMTTAQKNDLGKSEAAIQTLNSELDSYADMVGQTGNAYMPGQTRDAVAAKRRNIQLQMKELYNLGVLNGPDLELMDQMLYDAAPNDVGSMVGGVATSIGGALGADGMNPANRARANADTLKAQFKKLLEDKRAALGVGGDTAAGVAPVAPDDVDPEIWNEMTPEERAAWQ